MKFSNPAQTWDKRYSNSAGPLFGASPNRWLAQSASYLPPGSDVLSVADGQGRNSIFLAGQGHQVQAFDVSPVAIDALNQAAQVAGVQVDASVSALSDWQWQDNSLDAVVAIFIQFAGPPVRDQLFSDIARALRPDGLLIIEGYGPRQLRYRTGGPGVLENLYTMPMIGAAFSGWPMLSSRDVDLDLAEGTGHCGRSHVISAVLRRGQ